MKCRRASSRQKGGVVFYPSSSTVRRWMTELNDELTHIEAEGVSPASISKEVSKMRKAAIYARVGRTENAAMFLQAQKLKLQEYCETNGYTVVNSVMATGNRRDCQHQFLEMLTEAKKNGIETVVMESMNCIARSFVEAQEIQQVINDAGLLLETVDGSHRYINEMGELVMSMSPH